MNVDEFIRGGSIEQTVSQTPLRVGEGFSGQGKDRKNGAIRRAQTSLAMSSSTSVSAQMQTIGVPAEKVKKSVHYAKANAGARDGENDGGEEREEGEGGKERQTGADVLMGMGVPRGSRAPSISNNPVYTDRGSSVSRLSHTHTATPTQTQTQTRTRAGRTASSASMRPGSSLAMSPAGASAYAVAPGPGRTLATVSVRGKGPDGSAGGGGASHGIYASKQVRMKSV